MPFSRRFLLGAGVKVSIVLPFWMRSGLARAAERRNRASALWPLMLGMFAQQRLVVIDPGHGGRDPGCIGAGNLFEKDIALAAAWDLRRVLERGGYEVVMTRADDVFVPLQARVDIAERHKAALFLSMHANSVAPNTQIRGASVYTFSNRASDRLAATIADDENRVEAISNPSFRGVSPRVAKILFSLMAHSTKVESLLLQREIVVALSQHVDMLPNPSRHAAFTVLQSAAIPSILVETAFLSNPQDEAELRTNTFREQIAISMKSAVDAWFLARRFAVAEL